MKYTAGGRQVLVHVAAGIGNIVLATPLLVALFQCGFTIDVLVDGDYPGTAELLSDWSALRAVYERSRGRPDGRSYEVVVPAIPPFYWSRYARAYSGLKNLVPRPPDRAFYGDEQDYYLSFARALGCTVDPPPNCFLPIAPDCSFGVSPTTLVLAPGCKTGDMAAKRWPHFPALAEAFADVVLVGTEDDLCHADGRPMRYPGHVRSLVGRLSLRKTAEVLAAGGVVVANDSGLGHIAAAVGVNTILVFGPTPDRTLGKLSGNTIVLRSGLPCEPCWFGRRFAACSGQITCLRQLSAVRVAAVLRQISLPGTYKMTGTPDDL